MSEQGKRRSVDWDACHRDYRTGKFTLRELAAKYGVTHGAVGKRARDQGWQRDLTEEIRQATNARLTQELVANEVNKSIQAVSSTISVAAELNAQVVIGHRKRISSQKTLVDDALDKVVSIADTVVDVKTANAYANAISVLINADSKLEERERRAYGLDDQEGESAGSFEDVLRMAKDKMEAMK